MSPDIRRGRNRNGVVALNYHMAQLAGKAVVAVDQLTMTTTPEPTPVPECDRMKSRPRAAQGHHNR